MIKDIYSRNFRCSAKEAVILLLCGAPCLQYFQNIQCPDFKFLILICHYLPKEYVQNSFILEISGAPQRKQFYCFFRGVPCMQQFQNVQCPDSSFFYFDMLQLIQSQLSLKFQVLREKSSDIASFVEHPVLTISKMYSILILVF